MWIQRFVLCFIWTVFGISKLTNALVKLDASLKTSIKGNTTEALFYCRANKGQLYYLNHVLTWSKVSRDGRERYLSINWDLVQHGGNMGYAIRSQFEHGDIFNTAIKDLIQQPVVFVLGKDKLVSEDHGEYICRVHDFDRNLVAEGSVPVTVYENGIALWPYRIVASTGKDVGISCKHNTTATGGGLVVLRHVKSDGSSTTVVKDGKLVETSDKYGFTTQTNNTSLEHNVLTIRNLTSEDEGNLVCELTSAGIVTATTQAPISVDAIKLKVTPLFFLEVPHDAEAQFMCECDVGFEKYCLGNDLRWSHSDQKTGNVTEVVTGGNSLGDPTHYEIISGAGGSSKNLTIHGVKVGDSDYICSLHDQMSGKLLAQAFVPVSVIPVTLRTMAMTEKDVDGENAKLLCALSGTMWDSHYFDTHSLVWRIKAKNVVTDVATNGVLDPSVDKQRYNLHLDQINKYSIITIKGITEADHGEYTCELMNTNSKDKLGHKTIRMFGKADTSRFGT
ncbi:hypothetical protein MAR_006533 [Mya arenaria]|uniref:Soluble interferon alpha/beta receptor OPG204 n=1 Tax=Mya arenaria TaxID=6604 RepID=A0ABY7D8S0_MYAAR|nr:uncharacterized protein LOC128237802 [Mya arenaria]WAQ94062.1 hypothetical protein MAR_006533 [Mya arenaria]